MKHHYNWSIHYFSYTYGLISTYVVDSSLVFYVERFGERVGTLPFLNRWTVNMTPQTVNVNLSSLYQYIDSCDWK